MQITLNNEIYDNCTIKLCKYSNKRPAINICYGDLILLKASVDLPKYFIPKGYVCIKDYNENEGILNILINNKIIEPPDFIIPSGFVVIKVCKLLKKAKLLKKNQTIKRS